MGYRKRYEDSYLDDEDDEFDGDDKTDGERIVALLMKPSRTEKEEARIKKLTERLFVGTHLPGIPGSQAFLGLSMAADAYRDLGHTEIATQLWARILEVSEAVGNQEYYYKALDEMSAL